MKRISTLFIFLLSIQSVTSQDNWSKMADLPGNERESCVGFSIGTKGYIGTGDDGAFLTEMWEYDASVNVWTRKSDIGINGVHRRYQAVGFSIGSKGYIGTGYGAGGPKKDLWEYDPTSDTWTQKADFGGAARYQAAGFSIGSKGYIGTGGNGVNNFKDFWEYDPAANTWTRKTDFGGAARSAAVGFSIGTKGYLGTGGINNIATKDFWEYNPTSNTWIQKSDFSGSARWYATGFSIGAKGYVGTGYDPVVGIGHKKDFWEYDPTTNTWLQRLDFGGTARGTAVGFSIANKGYIATGFDGLSPNPYTRDIWEYTPSSVLTTTSLTSSLNPSSIGQSVTFTATVTATSGTPTGSVSFFDGTTNIGTGTLSGNTAIFTTSLLTAGSHNITAVYNGNSNYSTSTSTILNQVVTANLISTTPTLISSLNPSIFGQGVMFSAVVKTATGAPVRSGIVTFYNGTTLLGTGDLSGFDSIHYYTTALTIGSHNITATYAGNTTYAASTSSVLVQVVNGPPPATTTTSIVSSLNPSTIGQSITFTATVTATSGIPTGTVTFFDGTTNVGTRTLSGNTATFITASLTAGSHNITAVYNGNNNYTSSTSSILIQVVSAAGTTPTITSSLNPSIYGQGVMFSVVVKTGNGTPVTSGIVTFYNGTALLGTGDLSGFDSIHHYTTALTIGSHNITATYAGNSNYAASTSSILVQVVNGPTPVATTTALISSLNPSIQGQSITFTATVNATSGTPTGAVTFFDGTTNIGTGTLSGNTATISTSTLTAGSHNITAVYNGTSSFATSTSSILTQVVNIPPPAATSTSLISSLNPSIVGQNVIFTATVSSTGGTPTGTVTFFDGITNIGTGTVSGNTATFSTSTLTSGSHNITAVYNGTSSFATSTSAILVQVANVPAPATTATTLTSSLNPSIVAQNVIFTATLTAIGTPTGTVSFYDGITLLGTGTLSGNSATFSTSAFTAGSHNITAVYNGNTNFSASTSTVLIQVVNPTAIPSKAPTITSIISSANFTAARQNVTFTATVTTASGTPTGTVTFFDGSNILGTVALIGNTAIFNTSALIIGWHTITATYNGDVNYLGSTSSLSQTVTTITPAKFLHLYPNPIKGYTIAFQLNIEQGRYLASLTNSLGQSILTQQLHHNGGPYIYTIELPKSIAAGIYELKITGTGIILIRKVIKY